MKKFLTGVAFIIAYTAAAQTSTDGQTTLKGNKKDWGKIDISTRPNDHLMLQLGYDAWSGKPDSIRTKGFSRHFNVYFMIDKPFKANPRFSLAFGIGVGSSNIYFEKTLVDIAGKISSNKLLFQNADSLNRYKKFKLTNVWAEIPLELRFNSNPEDNDHSWKLALGAKVGTMLDAHTKGKEPQDKYGNTLSGQSKVIEKEKSRKFFNTTRIAATFRIGYGHFSLYGAYQITSLLKDGAGPDVKPYSIGLCLSGL